MRAIFIVIGAAAINEFSWVFYIFGLFLVYTAVKLAKEGGEDEDEYEENKPREVRREPPAGHQGVERHQALQSRRTASG